MKIHTFYYVVFSFSPLIAKSDQIKQTRISSLLSQLALSSQNKFFLKSPPKAKKKPALGLAEGSSDADLVIELDAEADSSESLSPTSQYENVPSALLDCAICDLVSLDSQAEVEQGIFLMSGKITARLQVFSVCCSTLSKTQCCTSRKPLFLLLEFFYEITSQEFKYNHFH